MTTIAITSKTRKAKERKKSLLDADVTLTAIAAETGYSLQQVSSVNLGNRRCEPIEEAIARACGRPRAELFDAEADA